MLQKCDIAAFCCSMHPLANVMLVVVVLSMLAMVVIIKDSFP